MGIYTIENHTMTGAFDEITIPEGVSKVLVQARGDLPSVAASPSLWLSTRYLSTLLFGTGTNVNTWYDRSGNGYNATQTNGTVQPVYTNDVINGRPALLMYSSIARFFEIGDYQLYSNTYGLTVFTVIRHTSSNTAVSIGKYHTVGNKREWRFLLGDNSSFMVMDNPANYAPTQVATIATSYGTGTNTILTGNWSPNGMCNIYRDGVMGATAADTTIGAMTPSGESVWVGKSPLNAYSKAAYIGEIIAYPYKLNSSDLAKIHAYLSYNWGITLA